jgi:hypothetical protein
MSQWTNVRIIYDLYTTPVSKECEDYRKLGIYTRFQSAKRALRWESERNVFKLGSERSLEVYFSPYCGASWMEEGLTVEYDDRATLVMFGNLRDCYRDEFIDSLNAFIKILYKYGIGINGAVVKIE